MSESPITSVINHLSNATVFAVLLASVGYLSARAVIYLNSNISLDPRAGIVA